MALVYGFVAHAVAPLAVLGSAVETLDRLVCCFSWCGRGAIVDSLPTASGFTAFALMVSVWPAVVF